MSVALSLTFMAADGPIAPKPLYRDPIHDGAADPTLIWNRAKQEWWMFYTNRRADMATDDPKNVAWLHNTAIGIATSKDHGVSWKYRGTAQIPYGKPDYTFWAPDIVFHAGEYHMFLTVVPGTFTTWNAAREIIHLTSTDLESWKVMNKLDLGSDRVIDPSLIQLPSGGWRVWYKDERDESHIHYADSQDLNSWKAMGVAIPEQHGEGPKIFRWHGKYWMIVDVWKGLGVYHSDDALHWQGQADRILETPGTQATDRSVGHHADVVVNGDRAFIFYFTHQAGADEVKSLPHSAQRTVLQVAELHFVDGKVTVNRDEPVHPSL